MTEAWKRPLAALAVVVGGTCWAGCAPHVGTGGGGGEPSGSGGGATSSSGTQQVESCTLTEIHGLSEIHLDQFPVIFHAVPSGPNRIALVVGRSPNLVEVSLDTSAWPPVEAAHRTLFHSDNPSEFAFDISANGDDSYAFAVSDMAAPGSIALSTRVTPNTPPNVVRWGSPGDKTVRPVIASSGGVTLVGAQENHTQGSKAFMARFDGTQFVSQDGPVLCHPMWSSGRGGALAVGGGFLAAMAGGDETCTKSNGNTSGTTSIVRSQMGGAFTPTVVSTPTDQGRINDVMLAPRPGGAWVVANQGADYHVNAYAVSADGSIVSESNHLFSNALYVDAAATPDGGLLIAWFSLEPDHDVYSVYVRRLEPTGHVAETLTLPLSNMLELPSPWGIAVVPDATGFTIITSVEDSTPAGTSLVLAAKVGCGG